VTNPLPLPFLLLLQVIIQDIEVRACAALHLMLPGRRSKGWCPGSSWTWRAMIYLFSIDSQRRIAVGQGQPCLRAQPCVSEQPCMQGKGVTACLAASVLLLLLHQLLQLAVCDDITRRDGSANRSRPPMLTAAHTAG
jgi:hypothetical protein